MELTHPRIGEEDIAELKSLLPSKLEGLAFESPINKFSEDSISEMRVEDRDARVAEYLKGIGKKLEELKQTPSALRFYDLAFRLGKGSDILMMKARTLGQLGYVDQAEKLLNTYLKQNPKDPEPYLMLGKHALSRADYEHAQSYFEKSQSLLRSNNVEHRNLWETVEIYHRFVSIYLDRDRLFTKDLSHDDLIKEIQRLRQRTQALVQDTRNIGIPDLEGMSFFLESQDKIFEKWLEEMEE